MKNIDFNNPIIVHGLEERAKAITPGLKHICEKNVHYYFLYSQEALDDLLYLPKEDLQYSNCYFDTIGSREFYILRSVPADHMIFMPKPHPRYPLPVGIEFRNIQAPDYVVFMNLYLRKGKIKTSPHNLFQACCIKDMEISTARLETCIVKGGILGMAAFPTFSIGKHEFDIKKETIYSFKDCLLESCICESAFITKCSVDQNVDRHEQLLSDGTSIITGKGTII